MKLERGCGAVLHVTSLPGRFGIGDLGPEAYRFVEFLAAAGQSVWQVMPLGPTGFGDSPYQCFSAFAGNPMLVSPDLLVEEGWLAADDLASVPSFPAAAVAYSDVIPWKEALLAKAHRGFRERATPWQKERFEAFRRAPSIAVWLRDYALFRTLKEHHGGAEWVSWDPALAHREPRALETARQKYSLEIERHEFLQFVFFRQWAALRDHARLSGIRLLGDVPIFVAHDSADAWAHRNQFRLDSEGRPVVVAGVPPDYFSPTGQLWGNPLYDWCAMEADGFAWWVARLRTLFSLVDMIRLDHFRGFQAFWEIPATETTAIGGKWVEAPGEALFARIRDQLGDPPIVAEDLGVITPPVRSLRDGFGFPGMKVLQFAFGSGPDAEYLPHNFPRHAVVYTGTHDNDTTEGWFDKAGSAEREGFARYVGSHDSAASALIRLAYASVADLALVPMQDFLGLGSEARMNTPGRREGNWSWRFTWNQVESGLAERLAKLAYGYGRVRR